MAMTWKKAKKLLDRMDRESVVRSLGYERRSATADVFGGLGLFAVGVLVGAGLGLMFAPARGEEMRTKMTDAWRHRRAGDEYRDLPASAAPAPM
jgi:hypothetical protein